METIFDHKPTPAELEAIDLGEISGLDGYIALVNQRVEWKQKDFKDFSPEYSYVCDLESLFDLRTDKGNLERIKKILETKFAGLMAKIHNE